MFLSILLLVPGDGIPVLPSSIAGWITIIVALAAIAGTIWSHGKARGELNGFGERLKKVEDEQRKSEGERDADRINISRLLGQHDTILGIIGGARESAESCIEQTRDLGIEIGSEVAELGNKINRMELAIVQRLTAVETTLSLKPPAGTELQR
jgi:hypothetical protein